MGKEYNQDIYDVVHRGLTELEFDHYEFDEEHGLFMFGIAVPNTIHGIKCAADLKEDAFLVYGVCPLFAEEAYRENAADFINRANYGLMCGNFEMDMSDGEIRYKTYVPCKDQIPSLATVIEALSMPAAMFTKFGEGLGQVLFGANSPVNAYKSAMGKE